MSRLVCEQCVTHLRDANHFHEQVLRADKCFNGYWENKIGKFSYIHGHSASFIVYIMGSVLKVDRIDSCR